MDIGGPVQVVLEMAPTEHTISGRISIAGAPATAFFGWLELIDRLERVAATPSGAGCPATAPIEPGANAAETQGGRG